ncbi:hypothetical protein HPB51_027785 [Rhipicephalus microplus]|uniref:Uncharacterized protein n=1 Tax=Rhipicephalus microplus TaxID=6941 RepID=A0A9J6CYZ0_RHIMP|nr:hypothetical protein HPB51_027785 [Rhipicephalus microplus]
MQFVWRKAPHRIQECQHRYRIPYVVRRRRGLTARAFRRGLHPSMSMASSSSTTVISRVSPDHRLLEADSNHEENPEPEAAAGVVPRPDCASDPVRDAGPAPCLGHGLNPGVAREHVPASVPIRDSVSGLARERLTHRAPDRTPRPGQTAGTHGDSAVRGSPRHRGPEQAHVKPNLGRQGL